MFLQRFALFAKGDEFRVQRFDFRTRYSGHHGIYVRFASPQIALPRFQQPPLAVNGGIRVIRPIRSIYPRKHGLEPVIVSLGNGVELVVVTPRALHGRADEGPHRVYDHVVAV